MSSIQNISPNIVFYSIKRVIQKKLQDFFSSVAKSDSLRVERFEIDIEKVNLISWLQNQSTPEKIYWQNRENTFQMAGILSALTLKTNDNDELPSILKKINGFCQHSKIRFYGGMRFNTYCQMDSLWQNFGIGCFILPRFEIVYENMKTIFAVNLVWEPGQNIDKLQNNIMQDLENITFSENPATNFDSTFATRKDIPSFTHWQKHFSYVKQAFSQKKMQKIVLARKSSFSSPGILDGLALLDSLVNQQNHTYCFYFQIAPNKVFLGVPPERLYYRQNKCIFSEAVAGTRVRSSDPVKDYKLGEDLLESQKDLYEHSLVVKNIHEVFQVICQKYEYKKQPRLLKLENLQHLYCSFSGLLKENITSDWNILSNLHPTAAVCSYPQKTNIQRIYDIESFDRGWFTGPIGWLAKNEAEFAVAIRSCVIEKNDLHLFAGAGIVPQSNEKEEWQEIENKMKNFTKVFCRCH